MSPTLASTFICSTCVTVSLGSSGSAAAAGSSPVGGADCREGSMDAAAWGGVGGGAPPLGCAFECCGLRFRLRALCCGMCRARVLGCFGVVVMGQDWSNLRCRETAQQNDSLTGPDTDQSYVIQPDSHTKARRHRSNPFHSHATHARPQAALLLPASAWRPGAAAAPPSRGF